MFKPGKLETEQTGQDYYNNYKRYTINCNQLRKYASINSCIALSQLEHCSVASGTVDVLFA